LTPFKLKGLRKENQEFLQTLEVKYPQRKTARGRLFAEYLHGETFQSRGRAAFLLCLLGSKRGLSSYLQTILEFESTSPLRENAPVGTEEAKAFNDEANFVRSLLLNVGMMNTLEAHQILVDFLTNSPSDYIRYGAMDGMAYEEDFFDLDIVLSVLEKEKDLYLICCALWVFEFHIHQLENAYPLVKKYVYPLLALESSQVHQYAMQILRFDSRNADVIRPFLNNANAGTRREAEEALAICMDFIR